MLFITLVGLHAGVVLDGVLAFVFFAGCGEDGGASPDGGVDDGVCGEVNVELGVAGCVLATGGLDVLGVAEALRDGCY